MPDQLTAVSDEQTRAAFAALRETALQEVRAPGPDAARRVLHRRRAAASGTAGLAVIAIAVAVGVALPAHRASAPTGPTGDQYSAAASTGPTGDQYTAAAPDDLTEPMQMWEAPADPGTYRLAVYCSGTGTGRLTLTAGAQTATAAVTCTDPPTPSDVELTVTTRADRLTLSIDWDPDTVLRNTAEGWAVKVLGPVDDGQ